MKAIKFNQDATCCVINKGNIIEVYNCEPFGKCSQLKTEDPQLDNVVELLFSTSLMAVTNATNRKQLQIVNNKRQSVICELKFPDNVLDIVMNRKRMCIMLQNYQIYVYDISCMKPLQVLNLKDGTGLINTETTMEDSAHSDEQLHGTQSGFAVADYTKGMFENPRDSSKSKIRPHIALSGKDDSILCYSTFDSHNVLRNIVVYDTLNIKPINYLNNVHKSNIMCLTISYDGTLVATASEKGTIIRVFNTGSMEPESNNKKFQVQSSIFAEFRRGNRPTNLNQLQFNHNATLLGCIGDSGTIHLFKLMHSTGVVTQSDYSTASVITNNNTASNDNVNSPTNGSIDLTQLENSQKSKSKSKQMTHYLSQKLKESLPNQDLQRDFVHINGLDSKVHYILGFPYEFPYQLYVAGDNGKFYTFTIPTKNGKCVLSSTNAFN